MITETAAMAIANMGKGPKTTKRKKKAASKDIAAYRSCVKESADELEKLFIKSLSSGISEPEKKCLYSLWALKAQNSGGEFIYSSQTKLLKGALLISLDEKTKSLDPDGIKGKRIFEEGISPPSLRQWMADYEQVGLKTLSFQRRAGRRSKQKTNKYSAEELKAQISKLNPKKDAELINQLKVLEEAAERNFIISNPEVEKKYKIASAQSWQLFGVASEFSEDGKPLTELIEHLASSIEAAKAGKKIEGCAAYQYHATEETKNLIVEASEVYGSSTLAAFFRAAVDEFLKLTQPEQIAQLSAGEDEATATLVGTARIKAEKAKLLEEAREAAGCQRKLTDSGLLQRIVRPFALAAIENNRKTA